MANAERGEVEFKAGDETYILRLTTGARLAIEERAGSPFPKVLEKALQEASTTAAVAIFWGMIKDEDGKRPSFDDVCEIMDEISDAEVGRLIGTALLLSNAVSQATGEAGGAEKGKPKKRSTGANSRKAGAKQGEA